MPDLVGSIDLRYTDAQRAYVMAERAYRAAEELVNCLGELTPAGAPATKSEAHMLKAWEGADKAREALWPAVLAAYTNLTELEKAWRAAWELPVDAPSNFRPPAA